MWGQTQGARIKLNAYRRRNVVFGTALVFVLLFILWISNARGSLALPAWVPILKVHPYGPPSALYGGSMWTAAFAAVVCILVLIASYAAYRVMRRRPPENEQYADNED